MMASEQLGNLIEMKEELIKKACSEAMKARQLKSSDNLFMEKASASSPEVIFSFQGSWSVEDWYGQGDSPFGEKIINLKLFPSLRSIGNDEAAKVNEAFEKKFQSILDKSKLKDKVLKAANNKKQIVFTGHSSGGPIAVLAAIWFFEYRSKQRLPIPNPPPLCLTFGSPLMGNHIFSHALRREKWSNYFIHFVSRYDVVPRLFLAPLWSSKQRFHEILNLFGKRVNQVDPTLASEFFMDVMRHALTITSHVACKLMETTNLLFGTVTSFIELSPYRPFGTYVFCNGVDERKLVFLSNSDAVLQLLFYSCQPSSEAEGSDIAQKSLKDHFAYETELQGSLNGQLNLFYGGTESDDHDIDMINRAADEFKISTRGRLCMLAAGEAEKQKKRNQEKIESKKGDMERALKEVVQYKNTCELHKVGYFDAFKLQKNQADFKANVKRLELAGIWDEIIELLKGYKLPDQFEGRREWIEIGTWYRRLIEPLDIANYYRHLKNEDTGDYMNNARPKRYRYPQRWREHEEKMEQGSSGESCFWADLEELCSKGTKNDEAEKIQKRVLQWKIDKVIGEDVFLSETTFTKWWKSLNPSIKSNDIAQLVVQE